MIALLERNLLLNINDLPCVHFIHNHFKLNYINHFVLKLDYN